MSLFRGTLGKAKECILGRPNEVSSVAIETTEPILSFEFPVNIGYSNSRGTIVVNDHNNWGNQPGLNFEDLVIKQEILQSPYIHSDFCRTLQEAKLHNEERLLFKKLILFNGYSDSAMARFLREQKSQVLEQGKKQILNYYYLLLVGSHIIEDRYLTRIYELLQKCEGGQNLKHYFDLSRLNHIPEFQFQIEGVSLDVLCQGNNKLQIPISKAYKFLVESILLNYRNNPEKLTRQNNLLLKYQAKGMQAVARLSTLMPLLANLDTNAFEGFVQKGSTADRESAERVLFLAKRVQIIPQLMLNVLVNPENPEFTEVRQTIESYIEKGYGISLAALFFCGLQDESNVTYLYRKAKEYSKSSNPNSVFFNKLSLAIERYITFTSLDLNRDILSQDSITSIMSDGEKMDDYKQLPLITLFDIENQVKNLIRKNIDSQYDIEPSSIDFTTFLPSDNFTIAFEGGKKTKVVMNLLYTDEFGDRTKFYFSVDLKRGQIDSNYIYDISKDQFLLQASFSLLKQGLQEIDNIKSHEDSLKQQRKANNIPRQIVPVKKQSWVITDFVPVQTKHSEDNLEMLPLPVSADLIVPSLHVEERKIGFSLVLPEEINLQRKISSLSSVDQIKVLQLLETMSKQGIGKVSFLQSSGNKRLFSVHINGISSQIRIILQDSSVQVGSQLELVEVGYRKDIYRRVKRISGLKKG